MKLNKEQAATAGQTGFGTGAHIGALTAKKVIAGSGAHGVEFTLWTSQDSKVQYLTTYFKKGDGSENGFGTAILMAMMGVCGVDEIPGLEEMQNETVINQFHGKEIGLVLQKVLKNKADGSDTYGFEIKLPFEPRTGQTFKEMVNNDAPVQVKEMLEWLKDRDDRKKQPQQQQQQGGWGQQAQNQASKMPF